MQGRLSDPPNGDDLDWFPFDAWQNEFILAKELGFSSIELVVDRKKSIKNPIWSESGRSAIIHAYKASGLSPLVCCVNFVIDFPISLESTVDDVVSIINYSNVLGFKYLVIPLFEASDINREADNILKSINVIARKAKEKNITLLLEASLSGKETLGFISHLTEDVGVVYDVGNATYYGYDVDQDLEYLSKKIFHVHIKDKTTTGENVELGSGNVDFSSFFNNLKKIKYSGSFTLETSRGNNAVKRAIANIDFLKSVSIND